jgi:Kelch motif
MTVHSDKSQLVLPAIGTMLLIGMALILWSGHKHNTTSVWLSAWQPQPAFQIPRRALAAVASGTHVYIIGGMDNNNRYVSQVEYAPILPDGRLGHWRFTSPLSEPRFYLTSVILDNFLYAIGGANGQRGQDNIPSATVERAAIKIDGSLGPWQRVSYLTTPRRGLQSAVYRNHIYAIGGYDGVFLKSVESATVAQDGSLSEWRLDPEEATVDRYIHSAASLGKKLYLLGGHEQNPEAISYGDVEMTRIDKDGNLLPWEIQKTVLKTPRFIAAAFAMKKFIYMLGGHDGQNRLRSVEVAPLDDQGRVGSWSFTTPLHEERSATALAVHGDKVYVFGGMGASGALDSVEMATQRDDGRLGYRVLANKRQDYK